MNLLVVDQKTDAEYATSYFWCPNCGAIGKKVWRASPSPHVIDNTITLPKREEND